MSPGRFHHNTPEPCLNLTIDDPAGLDDHSGPCLTVSGDPTQLKTTAGTYTRDGSPGEFWTAG
ncbi:MAG TPA: hypothetical protein VKS82_21295 [Streptosporangiaceae bacterium]|nr:hypothetical protein [Streptosporangiaceae bacterium]